MHDEASPTYVEMTENTGRGHLFLKKYFNIAPKGTWQIDPFGHTNTQGWLMGQYSGFQFLCASSLKLLARLIACPVSSLTRLTHLCLV